MIFLKYIQLEVYQVFPKAFNESVRRRRWNVIPGTSELNTQIWTLYSYILTTKAGLNLLQLISLSIKQNARYEIEKRNEREFQNNLALPATDSCESTSGYLLEILMCYF